MEDVSSESPSCSRLVVQNNQLASACRAPWLHLYSTSKGNEHWNYFLHPGSDSLRTSGGAWSFCETCETQLNLEPIVIYCVHQLTTLRILDFFTLWSVAI